MRLLWKIPVVIYAALLGLLFACIAAASILGLLGIYTTGWVVTFVFVTAIGVGWAYLRWGGLAFFSRLFEREEPDPTRWNDLDNLLLGLGAALAVVLLIIPVVNFPYTPLMEKLNWDAGSYHFPKALELVVTGSVWDLSIAYGEYPFGYESLYALGALLTRDWTLFGAAHGLTVLFMVFSLWFLVRRFIGLPAGVTLLIASLFLLSGALDFEMNVWRIFKFLAYTVGKNDFFLGAAVLAAILHAPVGSRKNQDAFHWIGFSISTMIAVSIKPNALFVVAPLWLWGMWSLRTCGTGFVSSLPWGKMILSMAIIFPGLLWIPRNLVGQGTLISAKAGELQSWNLFNHLLTPGLMQSFPKTLWLVLGLLVVAVVAARFLKHVSWSSVGMYVLLLLGFAITPGSAILNYWESQTQIVIAWRFGLGLLAFGFILLLHWFSPWLQKGYHLLSRNRFSSWVFGLVAAGFVGWFIYINSNVLQINSFNTWMLRDPYRGAVGRDGYYSPINYIQREVKNSVVWVENGMSYYVYGRGFTNSTSRAKKADYLVILETGWDGFPVPYPAYTTDPEWQKQWTVVYEDGEGRVYHRNP